MNTGPAVRTWDGTDIDRLAVHVLTGDGHALCSDKLTAMFADTGAAVSCKRCIAKAGKTAMDADRYVQQNIAALSAIDNSNEWHGVDPRTCAALYRRGLIFNPKTGQPHWWALTAAGHAVLDSR